MPRSLGIYGLRKLSVLDLSWNSPSERSCPEDRSSLVVGHVGFYAVRTEHDIFRISRCRLEYSFGIYNMSCGASGGVDDQRFGLLRAQSLQPKSAYPERQTQEHCVFVFRNHNSATIPNP